jgi:hypothetical protein
MVFVTLSCSLRWGPGQPYGFQRTLVTHVRANMEYFKSEGNETVISYMDDAYEKFGRLLREQGYSKEAETLEIEVLDERTKILGVEHLDTIIAMANLASTNGDLGKYTEAEKLEIQVLDARQENSWSGTPRHNESHGKSSINIWKAWENTQRQRNWRSKFWMQGREFLEWNTQTQSLPWEI